VIPEKAKKPLTIASFFLQVSALPVGGWFISDYIETRDEVIRLKTEVDQINAQWSVMKSMEEEISGLKINSKAQEQVLFWMGFQVPLGTEPMPPMAPTPKPKKKAASPPPEQAVQQYIEQKMYKYKKGK